MNPVLYLADPVQNGGGEFARGQFPGLQGFSGLPGGQLVWFGHNGGGGRRTFCERFPDKMDNKDIFIKQNTNLSMRAPSWSDPVLFRFSADKSVFSFSCVYSIAANGPISPANRKKRARIPAGIDGNRRKDILISSLHA